MTLRDYIKNLGYETVEPEYYKRIASWREWYKGTVDSFHKYTIHNKGFPISKTRARLNMAKQGCEYWANLLWNSECAVSITDSAAATIVQDTLDGNDFTRQTNVLIERAWALGSGAYVAYIENDRTRIDYIPAEHIFPLTWNNDDIVDCAFAGRYTQAGKQMLYLMIHERQDNGSYKIRNQYFEYDKDNEDSLRAVQTPDGIDEEYTARQRRFAIVRPNIANNIANVPLGLSVYANCIDTLKSIDLAYDGIKTSMETGKPRIGVTGNMMQSAVDPVTKKAYLYSVFDPNDTSVYELGQSKDEGPDVKDMTTQYRADAFEKSLETQLTVFSMAVGLGEKTFRWERGSVKTATEVVSNDSAMLRAMEKHQDGLRSSITALVKAILDINGVRPEQEITIVFDDSVTRDSVREAQEAWQWVTMGMFPFWRYLVEYKGYSEKAAKKIAAETALAAPDDDPDAEEE